MKDSMEKAESYFKPHKGLANDFRFPGSLLEELDDDNRKLIERKIAKCINEGDTRFFDAAERIKTLDVRKAISPDAISKNDDDYSLRSKLLEAMFINTHDIELLLLLSKLASSSETAFTHLASAIHRTDWERMETENEAYQLFLRALRTITCIKRVSYRGNSYEAIAQSNLRQGKFMLLSSKEIAYFNKEDPWSDCTGRDPLIFFKSLERRERYLNTGDIAALEGLLRDAVYYSEAYDVFDYMKIRKEIDQRVIKMFRIHAASGHFDDDDWMSCDPDLYRTVTKNK